MGATLKDLKASHAVLRERLAARLEGRPENQTTAQEVEHADSQVIVRFTTYSQDTYHPYNSYQIDSGTMIMRYTLILVLLAALCTVCADTSPPLPRRQHVRMRTRRVYQRIQPARVHM